MLFEENVNKKSLTQKERIPSQVRSHVEVQIGMIAKGQADKEAVVAHALQQFRQKFLFFVAKVARMDALFEASFSPLASSGDHIPFHYFILPFLSKFASISLFHLIREKEQSTRFLVNLMRNQGL